MAIAYKGGLVSSATGAGPFAIDVSSLGLASGDFVIVGVFAQASSNRAAPSCTGSSSGAFTNSADLFANDTRPTNGFTWHKKLTGADATITIGAPGFTNGISYFIRAYTGLDTTTQLDVAVTSTTGINTDAADAPSITPTTSGAKIVAYYFGSQGTATTWTAPSGLSNFDQAAFITGGSSYRTAAGDADWTSGAYDPAVVTNAEGNTSDSWAAVTYALRPASGGGGAQSLTPSLFTNSQTFYGPTVSATAGLTPSLYSNTQTFYAATVAATKSLTPSLFSNSQSFFAPTVSAGAVTLSPSLFTNTQSFYAATVSTAYSLVSPLLSNAASFYDPTLAASNTLSPELLTNAAAFFDATVTGSSGELLPLLFVNGSEVRVPSAFYDRAFIRGRRRRRGFEIRRV